MLHGGARGALEWYCEQAIKTVRNAHVRWLRCWRMVYEEDFNDLERKVFRTLYKPDQKRLFAPLAWEGPQKSAEEESEDGSRSRRSYLGSQKSAEEESEVGSRRSLEVGLGSGWA